MKNNYIFLDHENKYPIIFNLNVMEEIQDAFGSFDKWAEKLKPEDDAELDIKALKLGMTIAMNEAIDMINEETGSKTPMLTEKQVGRIITSIGLEKIGMSIGEAVQDGTGASETSTQEISEEEKKE